VFFKRQEGEIGKVVVAALPDILYEFIIYHEEKFFYQKNAYNSKGVISFSYFIYKNLELKKNIRAGMFYTGPFFTLHYVWCS